MDTNMIQGISPAVQRENRKNSNVPKTSSDSNNEEKAKTTDKKKTSGGGRGPVVSACTLKAPLIRQRKVYRYKS